MNPSSRVQEQQTIVTEFLRQPALNEHTLLLELSRRINNEFASAIKLVALAAVRSDNSQVKFALRDVVELLDEHADVLHALRVPDDNAVVDAVEYFRRLCFAISRSKLDRMNIHLVFSADALLLQSDRCWRLAMILYELVTNSARHAFFEGRDGEIRVELSRVGGSMQCRVSDNGLVSAGFKAGRGLRLMTELSHSLGGQLDHSVGAEGSCFSLVLPFTEQEQQANRTITEGSRCTGPTCAEDGHQQAAVAGLRRGLRRRQPRPGRVQG